MSISGSLQACIESIPPLHHLKRPNVCLEIDLSKELKSSSKPAVEQQIVATQLQHGASERSGVEPLRLQLEGLEERSRKKWEASPLQRKRVL